MAKKRKKKGKAERYEIVFTPDPELFDEPPAPTAQIVSFVNADPGWRAIYAPCHTCESDASESVIVFWALLSFDDGASGICGLCGGTEGGFWRADAEHTFIGYAGPGESSDDVLDAFFGTH